MISACQRTLHATAQQRFRVGAIVKKAHLDAPTRGLVLRVKTMIKRKSQRRGGCTRRPLRKQHEYTLLPLLPAAFGIIPHLDLHSRSLDRQTWAQRQWSVALDRTQKPSGRFQKQVVTVGKLRHQGRELAGAGAGATCAAGDDWQVVEAWEAGENCCGGGGWR